MNEYTKKCIESHVERVINEMIKEFNLCDIDGSIERIIKKFNFSKRSKEHPEECPCYTTEPCHDMDEEELNCFLCYCPEYDKSKPEGGCKLNNPEGKGFFFGRPGNKISEEIWDCSNCTYPNREETVEKYLQIFVDNYFFLCSSTISSSASI